MSLETSPFKLLTQEDWPAWFDFIRSKAIAAKIWNFVDPDKENPPVNVEPDLFQYTKDRNTTDTPSTVSTAQETQEPAAASPQPPLDLKLE